MTAGMENTQNDPCLYPIIITTDVDLTEIVLNGPIRVKVDLFLYMSYICSPADFG